MSKHVYTHVSMAMHKSVRMSMHNEHSDVANQSIHVESRRTCA